MRHPHRMLLDSVCKITTSSGSATGCVIDSGEAPLVLTCNHVIENEPRLTVSWRTHDLREHAIELDSPPSILAQDFSRDLALLEVPGLERVALAVRETGIEPGDAFVHAGYPLDCAFPRLVQGIFSGFDVFATTEVANLVYVLDGTIHCGQSGGPVCDAEGRLVGLVYAKQLPPDVELADAKWLTLGIGLAVPLAGLSEMVTRARELRWRAKGGGTAPGVAIIERARLAQLQHWLLQTAGSPIAGLACNRDRACFVRPAGSPERTTIPAEHEPAIAPMLDALLARRRDGGRFLFNGRMVFAFDPTLQRFTPLTEVRSSAE